MSQNALQNLAGSTQLIGQVFWASSVVEPFVSGNFSFSRLVLGFALSVAFFSFSLVLAKRIDVLL
jgi:hypothetical protein